jgi:fucose permease
MTPDIFGKDKSQRMIGMQMAFAYMGFLTIPPLFGIIANRISIALLPAFVLVLLVIITIMHELLLTKTKH